MVIEGVGLAVAVVDVEEGGRLEMLVETGEDDAVEDGGTWSVLFKKYTERRWPPPHVSVLFPMQRSEQSVLKAGTLPGLKELPQ